MIEVTHFGTPAGMREYRSEDGHSKVICNWDEDPTEWLRSTRQPRPVDACAAAQCAYCGRYGPLGACQGCGAANKPAETSPTKAAERPRLTSWVMQTH